MTTVAPPPAPEQPEHAERPVPAAAAPRADCVADSAGGLTFDLSDPGGLQDHHLLVLRRRHSTDVDDELRLPLTPSGDGRLRAALPSSVLLPEGRWDAYAELASEPPRRLVPGVNDLRSLVDRAPSGARGHVAVRIPYATKHGNLTVRSWLRAPHAEAGELTLGATGFTVHGRTYGTAPTPQAYGELRGRGGNRPVHRLPVAFRGPDFDLTVDYAAPAQDAGRDTWSLWLLPAGEGGPEVRVARLLDDVADRSAIFGYPAVPLTTARGTVLAGPGYTRNNDLVLRTDPADSGPGRGRTRTVTVLNG